MSEAGAIAKGLRCRCPACGEAPLFEGFLHVRPVCKACGADLSAQDSGDGPVAFIVLIVGAVVVGLPLGARREATPGCMAASCAGSTPSIAQPRLSA